MRMGTNENVSRQYFILGLCVNQPVDGVMDVVQALDGGSSSIPCVVDHIEGPTY